MTYAAKSLRLHNITDNKMSLVSCYPQPHVFLPCYYPYTYVVPALIISMVLCYSWSHVTHGLMLPLVLCHPWSHVTSCVTLTTAHNLNFFNNTHSHHKQNKQVNANTMCHANFSAGKSHSSQKKSI